MGSCPTSEQLKRLLDEQLSECEGDAVGRHVEGCTQCQERLEQFIRNADPAELERLRLEQLGPASEDSPGFRKPPGDGSLPLAFHLANRERPTSPPLEQVAVETEADRPVVPGYEILEELGRGGMGIVYLARQTALCRLVALKMMLAGPHFSRKSLERFRAEAETIARLKHAHIVQIYDIGEASGRPYFSFEYVESGSLARRTGTPQPAAEAATLVEILAQTMHYAHERGIIHCDLKPANVLIATDGTPKITDFGVATWLDRETRHTGSGALFGTPNYMPPEQARGNRQAVGPAADVYSLGAVLYELLTGRPPFQAETPLDTVLQVLHEDPVPPTRLRLALPRELETIALKCLEKEPVKRYAGAAALADDLRRFLNGEPIQARPAGMFERVQKWARRRPAVAALTALSITVAFLGLALVTWQWRRAERAFTELQATAYFDRVALADHAWLDNHPSRAEEFLDACSPALRQWEWHYLKRRCHAEVLSLPGHPHHIVFSRDGRYLALSGLDGVTVWDTVIWQERLTFRGHDGGASRVAFSPDGRLVASGGDDAVLIWDPKTGEKLFCHPMGQPVTCVAFSPDSRLVAAGSVDKCVRIWDAETGRMASTFQGQSSLVLGLAFSPDGQQLAAAMGGLPKHGETGGEVRLWDLKGGGEGVVLDSGRRRFVDLVYSPDGHRLAWASNGTDPRTGDPGEIRVFDTTAGADALPQRLRLQNLTRLIFSPDGQRLAAASIDQGIKVWAAANGEEQFVLHTPALSIAFTADGTRLASVGTDHVVKVWNAAVGQGPRTLRCPDDRAVNAVAFSPDGKRLGAANANGTFTVWDWRAGGQLFTRSHPGEWRGVLSVAFSSDGTRLATTSRAEVVIVWDAASGAVLHSLEQADATCAVFGPCDGWLAVGGHDGDIAVWDTVASQRIRLLAGHTGPVWSLAFSPDGRRLASSSQDTTVRLWDTCTGREELVLPGPVAGVNSVAFSRNGRSLASATGAPYNTIRIWDADGGQERRCLRGHKDKVSAVAFSPDGKRLASASDDGTLRLWDPETGREVLTLTEHRGATTSVAFSPDGRFLASGGWDSSVRIWDASP